MHFIMQKQRVIYINFKHIGLIPPVSVRQEAKEMWKASKLMVSTYLYGEGVLSIYHLKDTKHYWRYVVHKLSWLYIIGRWVHV